MHERVSLLGFDDHLRLTNGEVELVVATAFGPRVLRYARVGGDNILGEIPPSRQAKPTPFGGDWHLYGGHRLWHAPEEDPRTYWPDNAPVQVRELDDGVVLTQAVEPHTHIEKTLEVRLAPTGSGVTLTHRLVNRGVLDVELAPWALTIMARGGRAIFPQAPFVPHPEALRPARPLVLWPYTRMDDPRWRWGSRFITLRHDPAQPSAQKVGLYDAQGWMAYSLGDTLFLKRHHPKPGAHVDHGCNVETFTDALILELETLGPLVRLPPGGEVQHEERWSLFGGVTVGDDDAIAAALAPCLSAG